MIFQRQSEQALILIGRGHLELPATAVTLSAYATPAPSMPSRVRRHCERTDEPEPDGRYRRSSVPRTIEAEPTTALSKWRAESEVFSSPCTDILVGYRRGRAFSGPARSPSPRCFDGGDVDLPHRHHRREGTLRLRAASRHVFGAEHTRGDLPGQAPAGSLGRRRMASAAAAADDRVPVASVSSSWFVAIWRRTPRC